MIKSSAQLHLYIYVEDMDRGSKLWRRLEHMHSGKLRKPPLTANQMSTFCSVFHVPMRGGGEKKNAGCWMYDLILHKVAPSYANLVANHQGLQCEVHRTGCFSRLILLPKDSKRTFEAMLHFDPFWTARMHWPLALPVQVSLETLWKRNKATWQPLATDGNG